MIIVSLLAKAKEEAEDKKSVAEMMKELARTACLALLV